MSGVVKTLRENERGKKVEKGGEKPKAKGRGSGLWDTTARGCVAAAVLLGKPGSGLTVL